MNHQASRTPALKKIFPSNPKPPPPAMSLLSAAIPPPSSPPAPSALSAAAPKPSPASVFPPPPEPLPLHCPPTLAPAQSTHLLIAPPASPCWTPLRISAAPAPAATLPPSRRAPPALLSSAARILFVLPSVLFPGGTSPPAPANPTPAPSSPPATVISARISSQPSGDFACNPAPIPCKRAAASITLRYCLLENGPPTFNRPSSRYNFSASRATCAAFPPFAPSAFAVACNRAIAAASSCSPCGSPCFQSCQSRFSPMQSCRYSSSRVSRSAAIRSI